MTYSLRRLFVLVPIAFLFATLGPGPARAAVNICRELTEPFWVPPTPLDAAECVQANAPLCALGMVHCCGPTCRIHPECVLGGTFVEGHWETLECELMEPEVAIEQFVRGILRPADDFLDPIRRAAEIHILGLTRTAEPIPARLRALIGDLVQFARHGTRPPAFERSHIENARLPPSTAPGADIYLRPGSDGITLENLIILRRNSLSALLNEPPRMIDDVLCGRVGQNFLDAFYLLMHELVHVRQWDVLGRDTFLNNYLLDVLARGYDNDDFEREAFRLEDRLDELLPASDYDFAWVASPAATFGGTTIPTAGSRSSEGVLNRVTYQGTGRYEVVFAGLGADAQGNVQVTAASPQRYCKVASWFPRSASPGDLAAAIRCFDPTGSPADSRFVATYQEISRMCEGTSYLWSQQSSGMFEPDPQFFHGAPRTQGQVQRTGPGRFVVRLSGTAASGGHPQVTAYGTSPVRCRVIRWLTLEGQTMVEVGCSTATGAPADSQFSLQYSDHDVIGRLPGLDNAGIYLWANDADAASYVPHNLFRHREDSMAVDPPRIERPAIGQYRAFLPGYGAEVDDAALQLSAFGNDDRSCALTGRSAIGNEARIDIECLDASGSRADSRWLLTLATDQPVDF